jgi:hypothetical protein
MRETSSRRKALSLIGIALGFGLALTDAEAQTAGTNSQTSWAVPIGVGTGSLFGLGVAYAGPNYVAYAANGAPVELVYNGVTYYPAQPCGCRCGCRHHH